MSTEQMNFYIENATFHFSVEEDECDIAEDGEVSIEVGTGYEMFEILEKYYKGNIKEIFEEHLSTPLFFATLTNITLSTKQNGVQLNIQMSLDDDTHGSLTFNPNKLKDVNSEKMKIIQLLTNTDFSMKQLKSIKKTVDHEEEYC